MFCSRETETAATTTASAVHREREKLQLLRPLQLCRKREMQLLRVVVPLEARKRTANFRSQAFIRKAKPAKATGLRNRRFRRLQKPCLPKYNSLFPEPTSIHPQGVLTKAALLNYKPPSIINSPLGQAVWWKRTASFRSQALHWESFGFKRTANFKSSSLGKVLDSTGQQTLEAKPFIGKALDSKGQQAVGAESLIGIT